MIDRSSAGETTAHYPTPAETLAERRADAWVHRAGIALAITGSLCLVAAVVGGGLGRALRQQRAK